MGYKGYIQWVEEFDGDESTGEYGVLGQSVDEVFDKLMAVYGAESDSHGKVQEIAIKFTRKD